jgi:hypothetical protein
MPKYFGSKIKQVQASAGLLNAPGKLKKSRWEQRDLKPKHEKLTYLIFEI